MTPPAVQVTLSYGPATPQQAASWKRLWDLIRAGVENQSASDPDECAEKPEIDGASEIPQLESPHRA
jgi:hypothetical protein